MTPPAEWTVMARDPSTAAELPWTLVCRAGSRETADRLARRLRDRDGVEVVVTESATSLRVELPWNADPVAGLAF